MTIFLAFLENLRPQQWVKNLLLFAGVIFARRLGEIHCVERAALGAIVFCFASGVVYVLNDCSDRHMDALHPHKKKRPIPSGRLPVKIAVQGSIVLLFVCLVAAFLLGELFLAALCFFFLWNWLYTQFLKKVPVLDVTGIGMSFVIRATAGVLVLLPVAEDVGISTWLLLCTFFLSLFLGFSKRREELMNVTANHSGTRPALGGYTEPMLNSLIGMSFGLTMTLYALYTIWPATVAQFGTMNLMYTLPFVLGGMGRYLYLVFMEDKGGRPHHILLTDMVLQVFVVGWVVAAVYVIGI
jgi:4-hydroxybenzoate polyprenyltransferase